jgi:hypothetical protein
MINTAKIAFLFIMAIFSTEIIFSAVTWEDQLPLSVPLDPDQNRPMGKCNENNDCPPGTACGAFGQCV